MVLSSAGEAAMDLGSSLTLWVQGMCVFVHLCGTCLRAHGAHVCLCLLCVHSMAR